MSTWADVLGLLNYELDDWQDARFSPFQKYNAINKANIEVRKIIYAMNPSVLSQPDAAIGIVLTSVGVSAYSLTNTPTKIMSVRLDGSMITPVNREDISDLTQSGRPRCYFQSGLKEITLYPVPDAAYSLDVYLIAENVMVDAAGTVEWTTDLQQIIVDAAVGVISKQLDLTALRNRVVEIIGGIDNAVTQTASYWQEYQSNDY